MLLSQFLTKIFNFSIETINYKAPVLYIMQSFNCIFRKIYFHLFFWLKENTNIKKKKKLTEENISINQLMNSSKQVKTQD